MQFRNMAILLFRSLLLFGEVSMRKNVSDFQIDNSYSHAFDGKYYEVYLNEKQDNNVKASAF